MVHLTHKKKIIIGISAVIFLLCIVAVGLLFMYQQGTITIFANHTKALVPNVTTENTVFHLSDTEKQAEKVTILVEDKLEPYDLYYYVQTESDTALTMDAQNYALWKDQIVLDENAI